MSVCYVHFFVLSWLWSPMCCVGQSAQFSRISQNRAVDTEYIYIYKTKTKIMHYNLHLSAALSVYIHHSRRGGNNRFSDFIYSAWFRTKSTINQTVRFPFACFIIISLHCTYMHVLFAFLLVVVVVMFWSSVCVCVFSDSLFLCS